MSASNSTAAVDLVVEDSDDEATFEVSHALEEDFAVEQADKFKKLLTTNHKAARDMMPRLQIDANKAPEHDMVVMMRLAKEKKSLENVFAKNLFNCVAVMACDSIPPNDMKTLSICNTIAVQFDNHILTAKKRDEFTAAGGLLSFFPNNEWPDCLYDLVASKKSCIPTGNWVKNNKAEHITNMDTLQVLKFGDTVRKAYDETKMFINNRLNPMWVHPSKLPSGVQVEQYLLFMRESLLPSILALRKKDAERKAGNDSSAAAPKGKGAQKGTTGGNSGSKKGGAGGKSSSKKGGAGGNSNSKKGGAGGNSGSKKGGGNSSSISSCSSSSIGEGSSSNDNNNGDSVSDIVCDSISDRYCISNGDSNSCAAIDGTKTRNYYPDAWLAFLFLGAPNEKYMRKGLTSGKACVVHSNISISVLGSKERRAIEYAQEAEEMESSSKSKKAKTDDSARKYTVEVVDKSPCAKWRACLQDYEALGLTDSPTYQNLKDNLAKEIRRKCGRDV